MALREVYNSGTVPVSGNPDPVVAVIKTVFSHQVSRTLAPSGVVYVLKCQVDQGSNVYHPHYRWDAGSGEFIDTVYNQNGLLGNLRNGAIFELPGSLIDQFADSTTARLISYNDLSTYDVNNQDYTEYSPTIFPPSGYWGGTDATTNPFMYDPTTDRFAQNGNSMDQCRVGIYVASTGAFLQSVPIPGGAQWMGNLNPPYMMVVGTNGLISYIDYLNYQVVGHARLPDWDTGSDTGAATARLVAFDRYFHRILLVDKTPRDANFAETIRIRGFSPIKKAHAILPPYVNKEPQTDKKVKVFTRVIGSAGEGLSDLAVTFTDEAVGDVQPQVVLTDRYGYAVAEYDGLSTGGAETITVSVEQDEDTFTPSTEQGAGGSTGWAPDVHFDFNSLAYEAAADSLYPEQEDWDKGTQLGIAYGSFGSTAIRRPAKSSALELKIESGETGSPTSGTNGTFGGSLVLQSSDLRRVSRGREVWVGGWFYFPTGFDFTATGNGLDLFTLYNSDSGGEVSVKILLRHTAGAHTGWAFEWPNQPEADMTFTAHANALLQADTWHFIQYYMLFDSELHNTMEQRLWLDDTMIWDVRNVTGRMMDSGSGGGLGSWSPSGQISMTGSFWAELWKATVLNNWAGGAPATQSCWFSNLVWSLDSQDGLPEDSNGYQFISSAFAENL